MFAGKKGEKRKMKKYKAMFAALLAAACILTGCGGAQEEPQAPAETETVSFAQETTEEAAAAEEETAAVETDAAKAETAAEGSAGTEEETAAQGEEDADRADGVYAYHLETETRSWNDAAGQEACSVSL